MTNLVKNGFLAPGASFSVIPATSYALALAYTLIITFISS
jgi:hypothetical protein